MYRVNNRSYKVNILGYRVNKSSELEKVQIKSGIG